MVLSLRSMGAWSDERRDNLLDGGAPFYDTLRLRRRKVRRRGCHRAAVLRRPRGRARPAGRSVVSRWDRSTWPALRDEIAGRLATRTRDDWVAAFVATDACVTPVLDFVEAQHHPHLRERGTYVEVDGVVQAAPAPRFSRTPNGPPRPRPSGTVSAPEVLVDWLRSPRAAAAPTLEP